MLHGSQYLSQKQVLAVDLLQFVLSNHALHHGEVRRMATHCIDINQTP